MGNSYSLLAATTPDSILECVDEEGEVCFEKFFDYTNEHDNEANNVDAQNNRRVRRFKKRPTGTVLDNGEIFYLTPKTTIWFIMYVSNPAIDKEHFHTTFQLRFRVPYDAFLSLSQEMKQHELFRQWNNALDCTGTHCTPIELLILASLRILGRDWKFDDFQEAIAVSHGTIRKFFHIFCEYGATVLYNTYVKCPTSKEDLELHMQHYAKLGLHGCTGSMDATHIDCCRIPSSLTQAHNSFKSNHPARAYNITVNHNRRILYSTRGFPSRWNDKTIVRFDEFYSQILESRIGNDVEFFLYYYDSTTSTVKKQKYRGVWILVDNGYLNVSITVPPTKETIYRDELVWSKWMESVRKDVECTFGILKGRFTTLKSPLRYHKIEHLDNIWMTCCALHNLLLDANINDRNCEIYDHDDDNEEQQHIQRDELFERVHVERNNAIHDIEQMNINIGDIYEMGGIEEDTTYPNGCDVIPVTKIRLEVFRSRLIKHFTICKAIGEVTW